MTYFQRCHLFSLRCSALYFDTLYRCSLICFDYAASCLSFADSPAFRCHHVAAARHADAVALSATLMLSLAARQPFDTLAAISFSRFDCFDYFHFRPFSPSFSLRPPIDAAISTAAAMLLTHAISADDTPLLLIRHYAMPLRPRCFQIRHAADAAFAITPRRHNIDYAFDAADFHFLDIFAAD
jgi:hypothetical protein